MTTPPSLTVPTRPRVLFVGHDSSSPQIAASLLRRLAEDRVTVATAGTKPADPGGRSDEMLVAMGLDPAEEQRLSARALHTADRVISLGAGLDVARLPGARYEEWDLEQDDLIARVQALSDDLTAPPSVRSHTVLTRWASDARAPVPAARPRSVLDRLRPLLGAKRS